MTSKCSTDDTYVYFQNVFIVENFMHQGTSYLHIDIIRYILINASI